MNTQSTAAQLIQEPSPNTNKKVADTISKQTQPADIDERRQIRRILDGDVNAYGFFVNCYQKPIFNMMYRATNSVTEAEELTQETFVRAYEKLHRFNPTRKFFTWLYTIGLNLARDYIRKKNTRAANTNSNTFELSESACNRDALQEQILKGFQFIQLENALCKLPIIYREALILRYHEELPNTEVADALNIGVSAVKMRIKRGLEMLRQAMKE